MPMPNSILRVDAQRVFFGEGQARQQKAAGAKAAHERGEQDAERDGARADHQLQQLVPDDLVNQRSTTAACEEQEQQGQKTARRAGRCGGHRIWEGQFE